MGVGIVAVAEKPDSPPPGRPKKYQTEDYFSARSRVRLVEDKTPERNYRIFELIETFLFYLGDGAKAYIKGLVESSQYRKKGFHDDMKEGLAAHGKAILNRTVKNLKSFTLVDLGPGDLVLTLPLLLIAKAMGIRNLTYVPVDCSQEYLDKASRIVRKLFPYARIVPLKMKFEDLRPETFATKGIKPDLINIGPTIMNFAPWQASGMFRRMAPKGAHILASMEILSRKNTAEDVTARYDYEMMNELFAFNPLALLLYSAKDFIHRTRFVRNRVETEHEYRGPKKGSLMGYLTKLAESGLIPKDVPFLEKEDRVRTFRSYRANLWDNYRNLSREFFPEFFDCDNSVLALLEPRYPANQKAPSMAPAARRSGPVRKNALPPHRPPQKGGQFVNRPVFNRHLSR